MKVYFISGLGADARIFKHIVLPPSCEPVHLDWIEPVKNETLAHYAYRMANRIDTSEAFALVGLSLGGMIATEIANRYASSQTVLISSIPTSDQLPGYYKWAGRIGLHKMVPVSLFRRVAWIKRLFTAETAEDKTLLRMMIRNLDPSFVHWAFHAILGWNNNIPPPALCHIHGSRDEILPRRYARPTHILPRAGHMMVLNRAAEINRILWQVFENN